MEKSERFEDKLKEFYESSNMTSKDLYESLLTEKKTEDTNSPWYVFLLTYALYRFYLHSDLAELMHDKTLPLEIPKGLSYGQFKRELSIYKLYPTGHNIDGKSDTYYDKLLRSVTLDRNHTGLNNSWSWYYIKRKEMDKIENPNDDFRYKLYVPVANKDLIQFALMLLLKGYNNNIEFYFKYNNNYGYVRSDNIVIYATKDNINDYINAIDQIIAENPNITINDDMIHPFGINHNGYVSIAPYLDKEDKSLSSIVCDSIVGAKEESNDYEDFREKVDMIIKKITDATNNLFKRDNVDLTAHKVTSAKKSTYKSVNEKTRL